ncbi:Hypothetical_protein [Hexamita inflata]|uniref:Hypothetical_protein n=1 Tax=Hexamita inflata TaxID=28002 RepID=A0AA86N6A0_9EUKA|nr:Hypothetical protein HINF_LOCUS1176 [Hexamita inflata]
MKVRPLSASALPVRNNSSIIQQFSTPQQLNPRRCQSAQCKPSTQSSIQNSKQPFQYISPVLDLDPQRMRERQLNRDQTHKLFYEGIQAINMFGFNYQPKTTRVTKLFDEVQKEAHVLNLKQTDFEPVYCKKKQEIKMEFKPYTVDLNVLATIHKIQNKHEILQKRVQELQGKKKSNQ